MINSNKKTHALSDDVLGELDAVALATLIKNKEIHPREVVAASIARAKQVDPQLHAIITNQYEEGMLAANEQNDGFFSGIPIFIKDMTYVKGVPTYYGSEAFANATPSKKTDPIAQQIFAQGFINLGTSSMPEFGFSCTTEFAKQADTANPWNINHTCGGSSGGSAALVAAGVTPIAHGADGGGSIRIPAACCGLVGLKPTRGRLLKSKLFKSQIVDIATDGVITRSVRDTAYFYANAEKHYQNSKLQPIGLVEGPSQRKYKIGFTGDSVKGLKADKASLEALQKTVTLLESLGHTVKSIKPPIENQFMADFIDIWALNAFYCSKFGKLMFGSTFDSSKVTKLTKGLAKHHLKSIHRTPSFVRRLKKSKQDYDRVLKELDVDMILTPTTATAAPKLGDLGMNLEFEELFPKMIDWACFTPYSNASGSPSISLPLGFDYEKNLPIGMMFWANHGEESLLLDLAYQLEEAEPWRKISDNA